MKKKTGLLILLSFVVVLCLSQVSFAALDITGTLEKTGLDNIFLGIIDDSGNIKDPSGFLYIRILLFLLVFSVLYGIATVAPGIEDMNKGPKVAVTLIIGLISTIALPKTTIQFLISTYSTVFFLVFIGLLLVGGFMLAFKTFKGEERHCYFAKGFIFLILWYVTSGLILTALGSTRVAMRGTDGGYLVTFMSFLEIFSLILLFMGLFYLFRTFFGGVGPTVEGGIEKAAERKEKFGKAFKRSWRKSFRRAYTYEKEIINDLINAKGDLSKSPPDYKSAEKKLKNAKDKAAKMVGAEKHIVELENLAEQLADAEQKRSTKSKIATCKNQIIKSIPAVIQEIDTILTKGQSAEVKAAELDEAIKQGRIVEKAILALEILDKQL